MKPSTKSLLSRLLELELDIAEIRELYRERDDILSELSKRNFTSRKLDGKTLVLIDNFSDKKTGYKTVAFPRYRIEIV